MCIRPSTGTVGRSYSPPEEVGEAAGRMPFAGVTNRTTPCRRSTQSTDSHLRAFVALDCKDLARLVDKLEHNKAPLAVELATAVSGAIADALQAHPEVVVAELVDQAGVLELSSIASLSPTVVVSSVPTESALLPCLAAGARGFVLESASADVLDEAVAKVAAGHAYIDPNSVDWLVDVVAGSYAGRSGRDDIRSSSLLSTRQSQVLALVRDGLTNADIAAVLGMSPNSVKTHRSRAMRKLGTRTGTGDRQHIA